MHIESETKIYCEMPTPLKWNEERKWLTAITLRQPVLYLIRDHINMFIDLGKDWTTGPPSDYQRFIPMIYDFKIVFHHYELNVYVNDHNIIDKPLLHDENALLTLRGLHFNLMTNILSTEFRPESTTIPFTIDVPDSSLSLSLPRWNINALHAPRGGNSLANIRSLHLKLKFDLRDVAFKNLGWSIRHFMVFKENYLGSFTHFVTLSEYLDRRKKKHPLGDPVSSKYRPGKNNILQTEIQVFIQGGTVIMPAGLPGYSSIHEKNSGIGECLILTLPNLQLQFRMHDHYMEMSLNVSSITGGLIHNYPEKVTYNTEALNGLKDILHIDGLDIIANRLFGPQPRTSTYVCIWEVNVGPTKVLLPASGGRLLAAAGNAFRLNFVDALNAPAYEYLPPVEPDGRFLVTLPHSINLLEETVSFVKLSVQSFDMTWRAGQAALALNLPRGIKLNSNDLGGRFHRKLTSVKVPDIDVKVLLASQPHGSRWVEAARFSADAYVDVYTAPLGYRETARKQIAYIEEQDRLTGRARRMFAPLGPHNAEYPSDSVSLSIPSRVLTYVSCLEPIPHKNGLYLPHPILPEEHRPGAPVNSTRVEYTRRPRSNVARLSDSDTEEGISEADRDARLAKTRSSTPAPRSIYEDDQNMSSGDESDDEDLTAASSDSDWSEFADAVDSGSDSERETLRHYSHVIRHYMAHLLELPNLWDGCPFILVRDCPQLSPMISFEASVPLVTLQALQRIVMTDSRSMISRELPEAEDLAMSDGIAVVQATFSGLSTSGSVIENSFSLEIGFRHSSVTLDMSLDKKTVEPVSPAKFIFGFVNRNTKFCYGERSIVIDWEESSFDIGHLGPEYIVATGLALSLNVRQLIGLYQKWKKNSSLLKRCVVSDIIRVSSDTATVDPLSTIQPSYLVQSGLPHMLRTNTTFRFLYHLRNCLWHLKAVGQDTLCFAQDVTQRGDLTNLLPLLEARFAALDPDSYVTQLPSESLFPILEIDDPSMVPTDTGFLYNSIALRFTKLTLIVLDPTNRSPSKLTFADVDIKARAVKCDIVQLPSSGFTSLSQTSLSKEKRPQNVLKASVLLHFGHLTLTVSPHLMGFAQHILRVQGHHLSVPSPTNEVKTASSNSHANVRYVSVEVLFSLDHFCVQAAAENLVFEFGLSRIHGVSSSLLRPPTLGRQSMSHSVLFEQVFVRARSPSDTGKQNDQDILASLELANGKISTITRKELALKTKLHLVFTLGNIQLLVPRSALRLYRFIQEWRADFLPGIEATVQDLLSEMNKASYKPKSPKMQRATSGRPSFQIQGELTHIGIALQVMHGTWLSWEAHDLTAYTNSANLQLPRTGSRDSTSVPAFLWSIKSIEFGTHRGQSGQAEMKLFSFQFISR
ncbi:hypothetical protein C0993_000714 [Termitomyces sp. T159_Od127]|nr:hypothetical protein C0993_000714 [Termitomyces sp. T159_Od127]